MNNETNVNQNQPQKKGFPIVALVIGIVIFLFLVGVAVGVFLFVSNLGPREKVYLAEGEIAQIYGSPNNYRNKYVKLTGEVIDVKFDNNSQTIYAYTDFEGYTNYVTVHFKDKTVAIKASDYISIDGYIKGLDKDKNYPLIEAEEVKVISYMEAAVPTKKSVELDKVESQNDVSITVQKVEFADKETRVYVKVSNNSKDEFNLYSYSTILTQNGKQYETTYSKTAQDISSNILPGGRSEGILVFPKIEQSNFSLTMKGSSSNYEVDFGNFTFNLAIE